MSSARKSVGCLDYKGNYVVTMEVVRTFQAQVESLKSLMCVFSMASEV